MLMLLCMGVGATEITYSAATSTSVGSFSSGLTWVSSGTPQLTLNVTSGSGWFNTGNGYFIPNGTSALTMSVSSGYRITAYTLTGIAQWNSSNSDVLNVTTTEGSMSDVGGVAKSIEVSDVYISSTVITVSKTAGSGNGAFNITSLSVTVEEAPVVFDGLYKITYAKSGSNTCYMKPDFKFSRTASDGGVFKFTLVSGTKDTYYIQTLTDGGYLYANGLGSVGGSPNYEYHNSAALSNNSSFSSEDNKFKWKLEVVDGKYRIIPADNTNTAIAVYSDGDYYFSFYSKTYAFAQATLTACTVSDLLSLYTVPQITTNTDYTLDQIKTAASYDRYVTSEGRLGKPGAPTSAAYSTFLAEFSASGTVAPNTAISNLLGSVIYPATGYYYLHNLGSGRYAFSDEDFTTETVDYLNDETLSGKHVWKVVLDGTNVTLKSSTGATLRARDYSGNGVLALTTAYANNFASANGTFYVGCMQDPMQNGFTKNGGTYASSTNPMKIAYWNGDTGNTKAYWQFESLPAGTYDIYTVTFANAPGDNYVTYSGTDTDGNKTVYDGGFFLITKDAEVSSSDFTAEAVDNYEAEVSIEGNVITVTYTVTDYEALIKAYMTDNDVLSKMDKADRLGYPKSTAQTSKDLLETYVSIYMGVYTADVYEALVERFPAYINETDVVLPSTGKFYRIKGNATNKYVKGADSGNGSVDIPNSENTETDGSDIWYYNSSKQLINYKTGLGTKNTRQVARVSDSKETATFAHSTSTATNAQKWGVFEIRSNYDGSNIWYSNTNNVDRNSINNSANCEWVVEEVTELPIPVNQVGDKYYATLYMPVPVSITGSTAYTLQLTGDKQWLTPTEVDGNVPAEQPVLLVGTSSSVTATVESTAGDNVDTPLEGTLAAIAVDAETDYFLGRYRETESDPYEVGFFKWTGTLKGFRAYLPASEVAAASRGFAIKWNDDEVTGIRSIDNGKQSVKNGAFYDLSGRRVENPQHGLYIVNGKKVVIK